MKIIKTRNGNSLIIELQGRLDTLTSPELEAVINTELDGVNELTIDCRYLEYISSAGLRVMLCAGKQMNGKGAMKVVNVNDMVNEIFEITGFSEILTIE